MKPIDQLVALIANDARNVRDVFSSFGTYDELNRNRAIANCALRFIQAEKLDNEIGAKRELAMARANLVRALEANGNALELK